MVKDGRVIGQGTNLVTTNCDPTAHAEISAIRAACTYLGSHQLEGCTLYTSCEPCPMCLGAIYWARPEAVIYAGTRHDAASAGFDDAFIYEQFVSEPESRHITLRHLQVPDAFEPFRLWLVSHNRREY